MTIWTWTDLGVCLTELEKGHVRWHRYISEYMLGPARYMVGVTVGYMLGTAGYMGLGLGLGDFTWWFLKS